MAKSKKNHPYSKGQYGQGGGRSNPSGGNPPNQMADYAPYNFVPLARKKNDAGKETKEYNHPMEKPVFFNSLNKDESTYTGEIYCTLHALTPILIGNVHKEYKEAKKNENKSQTSDEQEETMEYLNEEEKKEFDSKRNSNDNPDPRHKIIFPFKFPKECYGNLKEKYGIPGSQLKGMIANFIAALTSSPLQRVTEHHYTFRPNIALSKSKIEWNIGIIVDKQGDEYKVLKVPKGAYCYGPDDYAKRFGTSNKQDKKYKGLNTEHEAILDDIENLIDRYRDKVSYQKNILKDLNNISPVKVGCRQNKWDLRNINQSQPFNAIGVPHHTGIDGAGDLLSGFKQANPDQGRGNHYYSLWIDKKKLLDNTTNLYTISSRTYHKYKKTQQILATEHLEAHPLDKSLSKTKIDEMKARIKKLEKLQPLDLIFFETYTNDREILTFGRHLYYRWAYDHSIVKKHFYDQQEEITENKSYLKFQSNEIQSYTNAGFDNLQLTIRRNLFGFNLPEGETTESKRNQYITSMAGRIHFNYAVCCETGEEKHWVPLKILGSPKPSAVEMYIKQNKGQSTSSKGYHTSQIHLKNYGEGELKNDPYDELRGRKFYLHHHKESVFNDNSYYKCTKEDINSIKKDSIYNDLNATARTLLCPKKEDGKEIKHPQFHFTVRFENLRDWELGMLLFALRLSQENQNLQNVKYGHKLGHGLPLGLGSCLITVDKVKQLTIDACKPNIEEMDETHSKVYEAFYHKFTEWFNLNTNGKNANDNQEIWQNFKNYPHIKALANLLSIPKERISIGYPKIKGEIHGWHSQQRLNDMNIRKGNNRTVEYLKGVEEDNFFKPITPPPDSP